MWAQCICNTMNLKHCWWRWVSNYLANVNYGKMGMCFFGSFGMKVKVSQMCLTLCDPMDCSPPGSFFHGILQARILEWVANPFSRGSSHPGIEPRCPAVQADSLPSEPPGKPNNTRVGSLPLFQRIFPIQELNWVCCIAGRFFTSWATRAIVFSGYFRHE